MDEIHTYQARILAALDKVSRIIAASEGNDADDDRIRQRDVALIDELEATLAEERADLNAERNTTQTLKGKLRQVESALSDAQNARQVAEAALEDARNTAVDTENERKSAESAQLDLARQRQSLDSERAQNQTSVQELKAKIDRLNMRIESQDTQFQRLKDANAQLRESNAVLRERNLEMLGDGTVIDQSLRAELEALKTTRAADVDEMDTILDELKPLLKGKINA